MSILQLIEITRRSFQTTTAAMNVIGQNITNEQTEGYKRRRVELQATSSNSKGVFITNPIGVSNGTGVSLTSIERIKDQLLASSSWEARSGLGASDEETRILSAIENLFPSTTGASLNNVINDFWDGWNDIANDPTDLGTRDVLINKTRALSDTFKRIANDLNNLEARTLDDLENYVNEFNDATERIAELNAHIMTQRGNGTPDFAAEDERDLLVQDLSELAPIQVKQGENGSYNISLRGMVVVQDIETQSLNLDSNATPPMITFGTSGIAFQAPEGDDGRIGALLRMVNTTIPGVEQSLDALAASIVDRVNTTHATGYGLDGGTGRDFFDATGSTADTIALSGDISEGQFIAASDNPDATAGEDNDNALAILEARTETQAALGDLTINDFASTIVSQVGADLEVAAGQFDGHAAVVSYLDGLERGVSGVSVNEELTNLIQYQQSFSAAARVLNSAQIMMDTLLTI